MYSEAVARGAILMGRGLKPLSLFVRIFYVFVKLGFLESNTVLPNHDHLMPRMFNLGEKKQV